MAGPSIPRTWTGNVPLTGGEGVSPLNGFYQILAGYPSGPVVAMGPSGAASNGWVAGLISVEECSVYVPGDAAVGQYCIVWILPGMGGPGGGCSGPFMVGEYVEPPAPPAPPPPGGGGGDGGDSGDGDGDGGGGSDGGGPADTLADDQLDRALDDRGAYVAVLDIREATDGDGGHDRSALWYANPYAPGEDADPLALVTGDNLLAAPVGTRMLLIGGADGVLTLRGDAADTGWTIPLGAVACVPARTGDIHIGADRACTAWVKWR